MKIPPKVACLYVVWAIHFSLAYYNKVLSKCMGFLDSLAPTDIHHFSPNRETTSCLWDSQILPNVKPKSSTTIRRQSEASFMPAPFGYLGARPAFFLSPAS